MAVQIGCFNRPWNQLTFDEALDHIAQAGFECTGLLRQQGQPVVTGDSAPEEIEAVVKKAADRDLPIVVATCPINLALPAPEAAEDFKKHIDAINALGADTLLMMGAKVEQKDAFCKAVSLCTDYATEKNVILGMKPHGGISATGQDCLEIVERIAADSFRIWYDPGNVIHYAGATPHEDVKCVAKYVTGLCIKDSPGQGEGVNVSPGKATVDFERFFGALFEAGFDGPGIVECVGGETPEEVDAEAKYTVEFLKRIISR
ncbi:MAG: sugar phosphate isomerase/epimerase [Planctomycetes bacterium]|nr:sugar phosphate isomerase/epimerase [Planctomycetota bacterium]